MTARVRAPLRHAMVIRSATSASPLVEVSPQGPLYGSNWITSYLPKTPAADLIRCVNDMANASNLPQKTAQVQDKPLFGKVAIVTGAASRIGLGHAMTLALVAAGARVAMMDINETALADSAAEARAIGGVDCVLPISG